MDEYLKENVWDTFVMGKVEKAVISICDERLLQGEDIGKEGQAGVKDNGGSGGLSNFANAADSLNDELSNSVNEAKGSLEGELKNVAGDYGNLVSSKAGVKLGGIIEYNREFTVQFNPSTMRISSRKYSDEDSYKADGLQNNAGVNKPKPYPDMDFSVTLVFEKVDPTTAFRQDTVVQSISSGGRAIYDKIQKSMGPSPEDFQDDNNDLEDNLQTTMDAFTAVIRNARTRHIRFQWNSLCYEGVLMTVRSNYTMFDTAGVPIRGTVAIAIRLSDPEINSTDMGYWESAYDNAFGFDPSEGKFSTLKKVGSTINSVTEGINDAARYISFGYQTLGLVGGGADFAYSMKDLFTGGDGKDFEINPSKPMDKKALNKREERKFVSGFANDRQVEMGEAEERKKLQEERDGIKKKAKESPEASEDEIQELLGQLNEPVKQTIPLREKEQ